MKNLKKDRSFTLIELLVVIVIIGILAGVITISTSNNIAKARDSKISSVMLGISKLLKTYSMDTFPIETTPCNIKTGCTNLKSKIDIPNIDQDMYYKTSSSGNFFVIYANKSSDTSLSFEINSNIEKVKEVPSFDNLVAYYPLSIGTKDGNTISDMSPNSNHGTNYGATFTEGVDGNMNKAMSFDGVDDYIDCGKGGGLDIADEVTVSAWIHPTGLFTSNAGGILSKSYGEYVFVAIAESDPTRPNSVLAFVGGSNSYLYSTNNSIHKNQWNHVLFSGKSGSYIKIYINGALSASRTQGVGIMSNSVNPVQIGKRFGGYMFNGLIDDVRIYNRALSEEEIKTLYNSYNP